MSPKVCINQILWQHQKQLSSHVSYRFDLFFRNLRSYFKRYIHSHKSVSLYPLLYTHLHLGLGSQLQYHLDLERAKTSISFVHLSQELSQPVTTWTLGNMDTKNVCGKGERGGVKLFWI